MNNRCTPKYKIRLTHVELICFHLACLSPWIQASLSLSNNIEGKTTEGWLVNEEGIFLLNFACEKGTVTSSWLVLRLPSNSFCYQKVVAKRFSITSATCSENVPKNLRQTKVITQKSTGVQKGGKWNKLPSKFIRVREWMKVNPVLLCCFQYT